MDYVLVLAIGIPLAVILGLIVRSLKNKRKINMAQISTMITVLILSALGYALYKAEVINYITTYESVAAMAGKSVSQGIDWAKALAQLVVILDITSLVAVFTPQSKFKDEPVLVKTILSIWAISVAADMFGTWYFAAMQQQTGSVRAPSSVIEVMWLFPLGLTFLITGIQVGILRVFGAVLEMAMTGKISDILNRKSGKSFSEATKSRPEPVFFDEPPPMTVAEKHGHGNGRREMFLDKLRNNNHKDEEVVTLR